MASSEEIFKADNSTYQRVILKGLQHVPTFKQETMRMRCSHSHRLTEHIRVILNPLTCPNFQTQKLCEWDAVTIADSSRHLKGKAAGVVYSNRKITIIAPHPHPHPHLKIKNKKNKMVSALLCLFNFSKDRPSELFPNRVWSGPKWLFQLWPQAIYNR